MGRLYDEYLKTYSGLTDENSDGFYDTVRDIYFSDEVQSLAQYEQHFEIDRLQHITGVAYLSYVICKKIGLDYKSDGLYMDSTERLVLITSIIGNSMKN